ncbi:uncharacterized protein O3Q21_014683 [Podargus strigoides]
MAERGSRRRVRTRAISEASEALWLSSARGRRAGDPHSARCSRLPVCWSCPRPVQLSPAPAPPRKPVPCGVGKEPCPQEPPWKERLQPGVIYGTKGRCRFFLSPSSGAEDTVVRSCSGDAVVCTRLGLAILPRSVQQARPSTCTAGWRTAERQELHKRKEGPKEKEASYLANAPSSATSESCVQLGRLLQGGGLCLHGLRPRVRVWPLHLVLHRASWEGMSPEPGGLQPQHPDLQLDQVRLRQRQEVHRHRLRDLALSLRGRGRLQSRSGGRGPRHGAGLVLLWEADGCAAGAGPGARGSWAGRCRPCPGWRQEPQYPPPVPPRVVFPGRSRRGGVREGLAVEHNHPPHPPRKINTDSGVRACAAAAPAAEFSAAA